MDRLTIVGKDGQPKYIVEGDDVQEVHSAKTRCSYSEEHGHHPLRTVIGCRGEDFICKYCHQTKESLEDKGEKVVYS